MASLSRHPIMPYVLCAAGFALSCAALDQPISDDPNAPTVIQSIGATGQSIASSINPLLGAVFPFAFGAFEVVRESLKPKPTQPPTPNTPA